MSERTEIGEALDLLRKFPFKACGRIGWGRAEAVETLARAIGEAVVQSCYICGTPVGAEGWHREGKSWCLDHRPVWSREAPNDE